MSDKKFAELGTLCITLARLCHLCRDGLQGLFLQPVARLLARNRTLDTSVISELWKAEPNPDVLAWIDAHTVETLYLSAVTVTELRFGLATMPEGKRRTVYQKQLEKEVLPTFAGRVLPFDLDASQACGESMARAKAGGKSIGKADGYIAATARACGLMVATRDLSPFEAEGLKTVNPWEAEQ